jgi:hypothetical protein
MDFCTKSLPTPVELKENITTLKNITTSHWYISNTNLEKICHFPELRILCGNNMLQ